MFVNEPTVLVSVNVAPAETVKNEIKLECRLCLLLLMSLKWKISRIVAETKQIPEMDV